MEMKRWIKDGEFWPGVYIELNGARIYNPTDAQLIAAGYTEYVEPAPTPEQLLEQAKAEKISALMDYDSSSAVNEFYIGGQPMWLTRDERTQISESISAYKATGATEMTKWFDGIAYTFELTTWEYMLNTLMVYASDALNVTEGHKAAINALTTVEAVNAYNFQTGYPPKPSF